MLHLNKAVPERRESEVNYDFLQTYNEDRRRDDGGGCSFLLLADGFFAGGGGGDGRRQCADGI